ncbi:MAG: DUF4384 domain-containing protein [Cyclobacteriaceae bacterium]|nr:DUF4384 domain-containing protein [Cyclobacteriaceae bacterium]
MRIFLIANLLLLVALDSAGQLYNTGLVFDDDKYNASWVKPLSTHNDISSLPTAHSLKAYCPRPGNQLQMNSSAAWATSWSGLGILKAILTNTTGQDKIAATCFSPAYVMAYIKPADDANCQNDLDLFEALNFIYSEPLALHRDINDFCPSRKELNVDQLVLNPVTGGFTRLIEQHMSPAQKIFAVKKSIAHNYPVVNGMYCPPSFQDAKTYWQPHEYEKGEYPGQALCIVGYDDKMYGGSFEVINSWGSRWGNDGFMWIRYEDFLKFTRYAYDMFLIDKRPGEQNRISGSVQMRLNSEKSIPVQLQSPGIYKATSSLTGGSYFRIYLDKTSSSYIYVFGVDETNEYFRVFPHTDSVSPAIIYPDEEIALPGEDNYIKLTGNPGNEKLCILYSLQPLDIEQLLRKLKQLNGDIYENISILTDGKLMQPTDISWAAGEMMFSAQANGQNMVLIQIDILHR